MKISSLSIILFVIVIFLGFGMGSAHADNANGVYMQDIQVQPSSVKVGETFTVSVTLTNNSTFPIYVDGGKCSVQDTQAELFTITPDSHAKNKLENIFCGGVGWSQLLDSGKSITLSNHDYTDTYVATESGIATITVKFSYHSIIQKDPIQTSDEQTISKSFLFTILDNNTKPQCCGPAYVPSVPDSPLKQFKSGIKSEDVKCFAGYVLVIKSEDDSPACVLLNTGTTLIQRGWAKQIITNPATESPSQIMSQTKSENITECDIPYEWKQNMMMPVMFMPTNSIGKICVQYQSGYATKIGLSFFDITQKQNANGIITTWNASKSIIVDANPNLIPKGNSTVVFTIHTGNQTGFLGAVLFCVGMPFAVGYDNKSNITEDDFPWMEYHTVECPAAIYTSHMLGLHGIGIKYVPYTSEN